MVGPDDSLDVLSALVLEDGTRWGEVAEPAQWEDAKAVLNQGSATPYHLLTRARGRSKTTDLAGMAIAAMRKQLGPSDRCYAVAADRDQGRLLLDAIEGFVRRTPMLQSAFESGAWRIQDRHSGATLEILAADAPGAWGLRPSLVVVDEIAQWPSTSQPKRLFEAVSSSVAKVKGARMVLLTTAGDPVHWAAGIRKHAAGDPLWRLHELPGPPPWMDSTRLEEQRRRLPESSFRRLFLNEWTASEDRLTSLEDLEACTTLDGPLEPRPGLRYVLGLDLGVRRDRSVAAVCHLESEEGVPKVILDRMKVWMPHSKKTVRLADVGNWLLEASRRYNGAKIIFDPWQAIDLSQRLQSRFVNVQEFTFSATSVGKLGSTLHLLLRNRQLALPADADLHSELSNVRLRETTPGVLRLDHDEGQHDDRAIALALAAHDLIQDSSCISSVSPIAITRSSPWVTAGEGYRRGWSP